jgi:uncharacterized secreted protein with C-terminal beta-propeller domain
MTKQLLGGIVVLASLGLACSNSENSAQSGSITGNNSVSIQPAPPSLASLDRLIEEGDIVWLDDPTLYVLNKTRGLSVVGLGNPAAPLLIGRIALSGTPVELYLHNGYILALNSDLTTTSGAAGSRLSIIDVRRPEASVLVGYVPLSGQTTNTRLVGEVLYVASDSGGTIESVNVSDPQAPRLVDRLSVPLGSYGSHVLATENTFFIASESYSTATASGECASSYSDRDGCTTVFAVDISAPSGALRMGASYAMAGLLKDRWCLDAYQGVLRVLVGRNGWWTSTGTISATLRTFRSTTADQLDPIASLSLATERLEKVMAVRFDGARAYVVTFRQTDPLFTIDLSDPAQPRVAGHLQTPGWLDFIIPRGDRLLGIGRDQDTQTSGWRLQASLYDVSNGYAPTLLSRIPFGDRYSSLPDQADNLAKVVRVIDELGILLVPYNSTSAGYSQTAPGQLEILSFTNTALASQGRLASTEAIVRAVPLPPSHFAAVTESAVGVIQISPPALTGVVSLNQAVTPTPGTASDGGARD